MINWSKVQHFKKEEFTCKCGCGLNNIDETFVLRLDRARSSAGVPFRINCGVRCEKHNKEVGGVEDSAHIKGLAVDISTPNDSIRFCVVSALLEEGFRRVLVYPTFVHVDIDLEKPNPILKIMK